MDKDVMNLSDEEFEKIQDFPEEENLEKNPKENNSIEENTDSSLDEKNLEENLEENNSSEEKNNFSEKENQENNSKDSEEVNNTSKETVEENTSNIENTEETESSDIKKYKETYNLIFKPFKANGKEIQVRSPEEVIKLMQMGANYTRKMQTLQPHLKVVKMLENNNLLDEEKLNYLIDIDKKNPEAIKKLLKDSEIDPLSIDIDQENLYKPNNYSVPNNALVLSEIVDQYNDDPDAASVFNSIIQNWDDESKKAIFQEPHIINTLVEHKKSGYYDRVVNEIDRQKTLGELVGVPFGQAYVAVGKYIDAQDALKMRNPTQNTTVDTKALVPESTTTNNSSKVKAASIARNSANKKSKIDIYALSDDEFLKSDFAKNL